MDPQNKILAYFKEGGRLTVNKALYLFSTTDCARLSADCAKQGIA